MHRFFVSLLVYKITKLILLQNIETPIIYFPKENIHFIENTTEWEKITRFGIDLC
jgi:hypothetical protein